MFNSQKNPILNWFIEWHSYFLSYPMSINMNSKKIKAQFAKETNPKVGLIVLSTDNMIEKDFSKVLSDKPVDLYVNRIKNYNPVTAENLKKNVRKHYFSCG